MCLFTIVYVQSPPFSACSSISSLSSSSSSSSIAQAPRQYPHEGSTCFTTAKAVVIMFITFTAPINETMHIQLHEYFTKYFSNFHETSANTARKNIEILARGTPSP